MSTNRRWPRMQLALDVQVRFDTADEALMAHTVNLSREGLFLAMDPPRPVGTRESRMASAQRYTVERSTTLYLEALGLARG